MKNKSAMQKHYEGKIIEFQKHVKNLENKNSDYYTEIRRLQKENNTLKQENQQQKEWIERLLQYTELSEKDIKIACEKDKNLSQMFGLFNQLGVLTRGVY